MSAPRKDAYLAREPRPMRPEKLAAADARMVDPATSLRVDGVSGRPTAYVGTRLMIAKGGQVNEQLGLLREVAETLEWSVDLDLEPAKAEGLKLGVRTVTVGPASVNVDRVPDAWYLLQKARLIKGVHAMSGVGLDHVVSTRSVEPQGWELPHAPDPAGWELPHAPEADGWELPHPDQGSSVSRGLQTYGVPGSGGRQPIAYLGPKPARFTDTEIKGRRPVVAILDTGCFADHFWFDRGDQGRVVTTDLKLDHHEIGHTDEATDPELHGDLVGPFDGSVDRVAGHGTFISGLVHQACPDAEIVSWRGILSDGPLVESDWITTLAQIAELNRRYRQGEHGGYPIDVLSLSMGYYHENEADELLDPILLKILKELGRYGTIVVCSAGNDSTDRPCYPAAFSPWKSGKGPVQPHKDLLPVVSVGARNPNRTDALFTNAGDWVRSYVPAASVMSTMPPFQGGLEPLARTKIDGRLRESIDPDDYRGGFAVWSGTSFAAPTVAGALAAVLSKDLLDEDPDDSVEAAVKRGWKAVEHLTPLNAPQ